MGYGSTGVAVCAIDDVLTFSFLLYDSIGAGREEIVAVAPHGACVCAIEMSLSFLV